MKKVQEIIKPYLLIILGALLLLYYLNDLDNTGATLAIGITGVIVAALYLTMGILNVLLGDKLPQSLKKVFDISSVALFPLFIFSYYLIAIVKWNDLFGPNGWIITILSLVGSLAAAVLLIISNFINGNAVKKLTTLFAMIFVLILIIDLLFSIAGNSIVLGNLDVLLLVIYVTYTNVLIPYAFGNKAFDSKDDSEDETKEEIEMEEEQE